MGQWENFAVFQGPVYGPERLPLKFNKTISRRKFFRVSSFRFLPVIFAGSLPGAL
jgi:hypothetical protein